MVSMHLYFLFRVCVKLIQVFIDILELHKQSISGENRHSSLKVKAFQRRSDQMLAGKYDYNGSHDLYLAERCNSWDRARYATLAGGNPSKPTSTRAATTTLL